MSKVYIAGKWSEKELAIKRMRELENIGYTITHNWATYDANKESGQAIHFQDMADHDIEGVLTSNMYIGIFDDDNYAYRGTFTELGLALAKKKPIQILRFMQFVLLISQIIKDIILQIVFLIPLV